MVRAIARVFVAIAAAAGGGASIGLMGGCAGDPSYIQPGEVLEVGFPGSDVTVATTRVMLPIDLETEVEAMERAERMARLGVDVPYVRLGDLSIAVEWTVRNLSDQDGVVRVHLSGGNQYFFYVPQNFVIDPEEDEEPPPLVGDIPLEIAAGATLSGVFREDQLREAAIDLELITRGGSNPFAAILQQHGDLAELTSADGTVIPAEAFAHLVQLDISLESSQHMALELAIRVRDHEDRLHSLLLDAPPGELTMFNPAEYAPPAP